MKKYFITSCLLIFLSVSAFSEMANLRIKDIAEIKGARDNQLFGLGYVVGLTGTGDKDNADVSLKTVSDMLDQLGIEKSMLNQLSGTSVTATSTGKVNLKNMAAVIVTAQVRPFLQEGSKVDVVVSSIGDCKSLAGGRLVLTPLQGANGEIYAVAQGSLTIGSNNGDSLEGGKQSKGVVQLTVANISGGGILEKDIPTTMVKENIIKLALQDPDFFTAGQIVDTINAQFPGCADVEDNSCVVKIQIPDSFKGKLYRFIGAIEQLQVSCDQVARVVINEKTGTIVLGEQVKISKVAISHGALTLFIKDEKTPEELKKIAEEKKDKTKDQTKEEVTGTNVRVIEMNQAATVGQVAKGLNAIGASPNDIIAIFQALRRAGALQAKLEFM